MSMKTSAVLLISCPDRKGLVATSTAAISCTPTSTPMQSLPGF